MADARVDGSWRWRGAYGVADLAGTSAALAHRYPTASVTKVFTAAPCRQGH